MEKATQFNHNKQFNHNTQSKWSHLTIKERISYVTALILIISGILIGFLSFIITKHYDINTSQYEHSYNIDTSILYFTAQCFIIGGSIVGGTAFLKSNILTFGLNTREKDIEDMQTIDN